MYELLLHNRNRMAADGQPQSLWMLSKENQLAFGASGFPVGFQQGDSVPSCGDHPFRFKDRVNRVEKMEPPVWCRMSLCSRDCWNIPTIHLVQGRSWSECCNAVRLHRVRCRPFDLHFGPFRVLCLGKPSVQFCDCHRDCRRRRYTLLSGLLFTLVGPKQDHAQK